MTIEERTRGFCEKPGSRVEEEIEEPILKLGETRASARGE